MLGKNDGDFLSSYRFWSDFSTFRDRFFRIIKKKWEWDEVGRRKKKDRGEEEERELEGDWSFGQAMPRALSNTKAFARYLYNLTSIIMDEVRCFIRLTIARVTNYTAAM